MRHIALSLLIASSAHAESCFQPLAATRNYTLGQPRHVLPTPDGKTVLFLRSAARDTKLGLFAYDLAAATERPLAQPSAAPEHLSVEEKALRERTRMTLTGITDYTLSEDGSRILVAQADHLALISLPSDKTTPIPGIGWINPRLSPDGQAIAGVRDNDVHVTELANGHDQALTSGGTDIITHGLPDFAAAEEFDRAEGLWWSPDSSHLVYEQADSSGVERHFIADPEHPSIQPTEFRYPRAGTTNAKLRLGLIARTGGKTTWIDWDSIGYPYIARVLWQKVGHLSLVVLNRAQTSELLLSVDPQTGRTTRLLQDMDSAWLNLDASHGLGLTGAKPLPYWLPGNAGFLWAAERTGVWQLELHRPDGTLDHAVTSASLPFVAVNDMNPTAGTVTFTANPDRLGANIFRQSITSNTAKPEPLDHQPGLHDTTFNDSQHNLFVDRISGADGTARADVVDIGGKVLATLRSLAEQPPAIPKVQFTTVGEHGMDAVVIHPTDTPAGAKLPVILSVYGGPTIKVVLRNPRDYFEDQCMADQGFIVASIDGHGTPGRGRDWERATKSDFIDLPLQDQITGLQALAKSNPDMDMSRTGITGWSFGGYFTAMATIRRPDIFKAGVAGAPVVDFADYDTAYTERYLGLPQTSPDAYRVTSVLTYAKDLSRPLLIMHGLTDDNVYFQNSVKLTQALIAAGRSYSLLLLPGTHQLPDPVLRARVGEARALFLKSNLGR